jgi:hypothetical protein
LLPRGTWIIAVENLYLNKSALRHEESLQDEHSIISLVKLRSPQQSAHGDEPGIQSQKQNNLQMVVNYGLTDRLMLMASVPYTFNSFSEGERNLRFNGFGDPEVMGFLHLGTVLNNSLAITVAGGARLPLGQTNDRNDAGELLHAHDQIGSGAYAGLLGVQLSHLTGRWPIFFSVGYQLNGANDRGFRYGNVFRFNLAAQRRLFSRIDLITEVNGRAAEYDQEDGQNEDNTGGTVLYISPGLRFRLAGGLAFRGQVQIPVVEELSGVQDEKTNVRAGLVWSL